MFKPKLHFEQIPIEAVKKIMERQTEEDKPAVLSLAAHKKSSRENTEEPITVTRRFAGVIEHECSI